MPQQVYVGASSGANGIRLDGSTDQTLTVIKNGASSILNAEDIKVTNKLKALAAGTPGANSKMLIYDTVTKAFNHTNIPSGADLPSYILPTKLVIPKPPGGATEYHIELQNTSSKKLILTADYLYMTGTIGAFSKDARIDFPQFKRLAETSAPIYLKWSPLSTTLILAPPAQWNAASAILDYNDVPINKFPLSVVGDILYIDFASYPYPMTTNQKVHFPIMFDTPIPRASAAILDISYENGNITPNAHWGTVTRVIGAPRSDNAFIITLTASTNTTLNACLKIKLKDMAFPFYSNVMSTTPTTF
jgi:hypothetical protein